jgi:hypothetical protein
MAGKRQHVLPRFLLRGFASRTDGKKTFVWVYRKLQEPFETTVENVGLEKHFYGKSGELSADDVITNLEGGYANLVSALRATADGDEVCDARVPEFITHLTIRSKQLREFVRTSSEYLLEEVTSHLMDPANLKRLLLSRPERIQQELEKRLEAYDLPRNQKRLFMKRAKAYAPAMVNKQMAELQKTLTESVDEIRNVLPRAVRDGHIKSLAKDAAPETRAQTYRDLHWFIRESPVPLILGDFGCLFEVSAKRQFKPMDDMGDPIVNTFLPVSSRKMLIGTSYSTASQVDFALVNKATAKCSHEYFVASDCSAVNNKLASTIGHWAGLLTEEEVDALLPEIIADLERDPFGRTDKS